MKLYKKLLFPAVALMAAGAFSACDEDNTLGGADAVYLEITPSDIQLCLGDTVGFSASVTNVSGDQIATPITWTIDRKEGEPEIVRMLGDSALVAVEGAIGRTTTLRATLENGKYALADVRVVANKPQAVMPVDTAKVYAPVRSSYNIGHDSVVFLVTPKLLLRDFTPTFKIEGEGLEPYGDSPMYINYDEATVAIHYSAARKSGEGKISVTIGDGATAQTGECIIRMNAPVEGASFYGPDYYGMPYIETRPPLGTLRMYYAATYDRNLDINGVDTCRVAVNVLTGSETEIKEAYNCCHWTALEGSSVMVVDMYNEYVPGHGFDAVLVVRSGISKGQTMFEFTTPCDTLTATFNVFDLKNDFPVEEITVDKDRLDIFTGQTGLLTMGVLPAGSFAYHKPKLVADDPSVISIGEYAGNVISVTGLKEGETMITMTSNGVVKRFPVKVTEGVRSVLWKEFAPIAFAGETMKWSVAVVTPSGAEADFPVEWISSDEDVVKVEADADNQKVGIVKGIAAGKADIRAKVLDKTSDARTLRVLAAPSQDMLIPSDAYTEAYGDNSDFVVNIECGDEYAYEYVTITLAGAYNGSLSGTFAPGEGSTIAIDGRTVAVVGGSLTLESKGADEAIINGTVEFEVEGLGRFSFKISGLKASVY